MTLKRAIPYVFLFSSFGVWVSSILSIYIPMSILAVPNFAALQDSLLSTVFLASAVAFSATCFVVGLRMLEKPPLAGTKK